MKLLDFDLEKALENPERVVFADGSKVEEWYYFKTSKTNYKIGVVSSNGYIHSHNIDGKRAFFSFESEKDLKLLPLTKTFYYCIYLTQSKDIRISSLYDNLQKMRNTVNNFNSTGKILEERTFTQEIED